MSLCRNTLKSSVVIIGILLLCVICILPNFAQAQRDTPPKADLFAGYQWLSPGGNVPIPGSFDSSGNLLSRKLPGMPQGFGLAFGYNFHPNFALEGDFGGNYKDGTDFNTYSLGPRATWRSEGVNIFAHTLLSLNRLNVPSVGAKNGIGAILGGGIDLKVNRYFNIRLIEADYQWARHSFANVVPVRLVRRRPIVANADCAYDPYAQDPVFAEPGRLAAAFRHRVYRCNRHCLATQPDRELF